MTFGYLTFTRNKDYRSGVSIWQDTVDKKRLNPRAHCNLGLTLIDEGKTRKGLANLNKSLEINPDFAPAHVKMGIVLVEKGEIENGLFHLRLALQLDTASHSAHYNFGVALAKIGSFEQAAHHFSQALRINPHYDKVRYNLALALLQTGKTPQAIDHFRLAILDNPHDSRAHNNLAWILATERACRLTDYNLAGHLDTLAAAYAEDGQFDQAVRAAQNAGRLASAAGRKQLVAEIDGRLKLYKSGCPYRQP